MTGVFGGRAQPRDDARALGGAVLAVPAVMHSEARESVPPPSAPPSFDVAAVASVAGLRDTAGNVPLDACVPTRTLRVLPASLGVRAAFVLLHVDGNASLQDIASLACLPLPDAIEAFLQLLSLGLVGVRDEQALTGVAGGPRPAAASVA